MKTEKPIPDRKPLVSVVIPAYNVMPYIAQCVDSVRSQTYKNLEIILVDDGSVDGTDVYLDEIACLDARVVVLHQKNEGVVSARNTGIRHAHGQYIAFVDGDDWVETDMIEEMAGRIGTADMISVGVYREEMSDYFIKCIDRFKPGIYKEKENMEHLYGKMIYDQETGYLQPMTPWMVNKLYISSKVKEIHEKIDRDIVFAEDSIFLYLYMLECKSVVVYDRCFYYYRYREESAIHRMNENKLADINKVYHALAEPFRRHPMDSELLFQLQKWVVAGVCFAINEYMGFDSRIHIPQYMADLNMLQNKSVILYGAGRVGHDFYQQMKQFGYDVALWVDKNYGRYQKQGLPVSNPLQILDCSYDFILIAIEDGKVAEKIRQILTGQGILKDKIMWRKPMKLY